MTRVRNRKVELSSKSCGPACSVLRLTTRSVATSVVSGSAHLPCGIIVGVPVVSWLRSRSRSCSHSRSSNIACTPCIASVCTPSVARTVGIAITFIFALFLRVIVEFQLFALLWLLVCEKIRNNLVGLQKNFDEIFSQRLVLVVVERRC